MNSSAGNWDPRRFYDCLLQLFPYAPTQGQDRLFRRLAGYVFDPVPKGVFLIKGYAGTGKTSVVGALVNALERAGMGSVLMAPTGRAAKVMHAYSGRPAFTVHRKIYYASRSQGGGMRFSLQRNRHENTVFIADEASMIPDGGYDLKLFAGRSLLEDLLEYVYSGKNCRLILVGDTAQLPPVHAEVSPALEEARLGEAYGLRVQSMELDEVMRQHQGSGILSNATRVRTLAGENRMNRFRFQLDFPDVIRLTDPYDIQDAIFTAYNDGTENTVFIVRSNKRANLYNRQVRNSIFGYEGEITTGDYVMVVKNNYYWLRDSQQVPFIANGDICEILEIFRFSELYGFHFAEVKMRMVDYEDQPPFETVLLLDTLRSDAPSLNQDESYRLYQEVEKDYAEERSKYKRMLQIKENKYFNALQIKFSYAMTCHKTQGGQWDHVFVEQPYLPDGEDISYLRWLYTALTRAQKKLYLIGFNEEYFED